MDLLKFQLGRVGAERAEHLGAEGAAQHRLRLVPAFEQEGTIQDQEVRRQVAGRAGGFLMDMPVYRIA